MNFNEWFQEIQQNNYKITKLYKIVSWLTTPQEDDGEYYEDDYEDDEECDEEDEMGFHRNDYEKYYEVEKEAYLTYLDGDVFLILEYQDIEKVLTIDELEEIYKMEFEDNLKENKQYPGKSLPKYRIEGDCATPITKENKKNPEKVKLDKKIQENITQDLFNKYQNELFKLCKTYEDQLGNTDINTIIEQWKYSKNSLYVVLFRLYNAYAIELLTYPDSKEFNFNGHYGSHLRRKMQ